MYLAAAVCCWPARWRDSCRFCNRREPCGFPCVYERRKIVFYSTAEQHASGQQHLAVAFMLPGYQHDLPNVILLRQHNTQVVCQLAKAWTWLCHLAVLSRRCPSWLLLPPVAKGRCLAAFSPLLSFELSCGSAPGLKLVDVTS